MSTPRGLVVFIAMAAVVLPASASEPPSFGACDERVRDAPLQLESYRCYLQASVVPGGVPRAVRRLRSILAIDPDNPYADMALAAILTRAGEEDPDARYGRAIRELQARGDAETEILAWSLRIDARIGRGDFVAARVAIANLRQRADALRSAPAHHVATLAEAQLASREGHYDRAHTILAALEPDILERGDPRALSRLLSQMGFIYWATGRHAEAARCYERRLELIETTGEGYEEPSIRYNLALMHSFVVTRPLGPDGWSSLREQFTEVLAIAQAHGNRQIELKARITLAEIDETDVDNSREHLHRALGLAVELGRFEDYVLALRTLGWSFFRNEPRDIDRAFALADEAVARARAVGDPVQEARGRFCLAAWRSELALASGWNGEARGQALSAFDAALDVIERMRDLQQDDEIRARTFGVWAFVYRRYVEVALRGFLQSGSEEDLGIALEVGERMRARVLLDELDAAGAAQPSLPVAPALSEVRTALEPGDVLLSYQLGADQIEQRPSWLVAHTRDGTDVYEMPSWQEIRARVDVFTGMVQGDDHPEAAATALFRSLVEPALRDLPDEATHLIVIADGPLHRLPFAALQPATGAEPIGATHRVSVVPSVTAWLHMRAQNTVSDRVTVFADPSGPVVPIAELREPASEWGSLPWARREARWIARTLPDVVVRNGHAATRESVHRATAGHGVGILHFATHAYTDWDHPDRSAVVLAPGAPGEDGRLLVRDIVDLELDGAVVVLSACGSASGTALDGEGPMSLARGFFVAGARTVVATLWPLRDRDARAFFEPFYAAIAKGASVAEAATRARGAAIEAGLPASAWAGIVVAGDGAAVPVPGGVKPNGTPAWPWVIAGIAILGAVVVASRRRS